MYRGIEARYIFGYIKRPGLVIPAHHVSLGSQSLGANPQAGENVILAGPHMDLFFCFGMVVA
jgi:hypothetical protein